MRHITSDPFVFASRKIISGKVYYRPEAYQASKLMNALFSVEISR
jgi:hypothetical protein